MSADRLQTDLRAEQPGRHTLNYAPLPDGRRVETGVCCEPSRALMRITAEEVKWVFSHDDPEVVLRLGEKAVRVDELEPVRTLQCIPLMDVAVNQDGLVVAMCGGAPLCAGECVIDGAF